MESKEHSTELRASMPTVGSRRSGSSAVGARRMVSTWWFRYLSGGLTTCVIFLMSGAIPLLKDTLYIGLPFAASAAIFTGIYRHRPRPSAPWWILGFGMLSYAILNVPWRYATPPSPVDQAFLVAYGLLAAAIAAFVLQRTRRGAQRRLWLDTAILTTGAAFLAYALLIHPYLGAQLSLPTLIASIGYPIMDIVILVGIVLLAISPGDRGAPFWMLLAAFGTQLAADVTYSFDVLDGSYAFGDFYSVGWLLTWALIGAAALHPGMKLLALPSVAASDTRGLRLVMLGAAALVPSVVNSVAYFTGAHLPFGLMSAGAILLILLITARMAGLAHDAWKRERELRQSNEQLIHSQAAITLARTAADEANLAKSEFISRMSHELRTPLNAILGFAQVVHEDADEETDSDVRQILRAGRHLLSLINEMLDLSQIESGEFSVSLEPVVIAEVVEECVELVVPLATKRSIKILDSLEAHRDLHVMADRQRLKQVLLNVLSNAIKYNKEGGTVEVSCALQDDSLRLVVRDTGPGIRHESLDQLFAPFARLGAETGDIEGTGLGLALSLRLIHLMDGDMSVGRTGPEGTEFWLLLKSAEAVATVGQVDTVDHPRRAGPGNGDAITILQVEDNAANVRLLERILEKRPNVRLVTVQRGDEAVEAAAVSRPALVLLDMNLADILGSEVLARLRAEPATRHIPVIMLSADASERQIAKLLAAGAAAYVTKPLDVNHFLKVIDETLEQGVAA